MEITLEAHRDPCEIRPMRNDDPTPIAPGAPRLCLCSRFLWKERSLLVVTGDFAALAAGKSAYDARYGIEPGDGAGIRQLERLLPAAALAAVSLAERESWGWTLTAAGAGHGLFCAVEPEGMICGIARAADPERAAAYLQRRKGDGPLVESHFEPDAIDPVGTVQRYFEKVEQIATRIALGAGGDGALVQALPGGALAGLEAADADALIAELRELIASDRVDHLDDVVIFYECRCDERVIRGMLDGLSDAARRELWGDQPEIRITCPRCGREFPISRDRRRFSETSGENGR
jgi:molecular chaperone Hsp33